ncbi:MAG: hypothetical protein ACOX6T_15895 [Myxococcales bacterium]|jgi:hypothetical protein
MKTNLLIAAVLLQSSLALAQASSAPYPATTLAPSRFPAGKSETINIVQWSANELPKVYQRSEQLPLTDADIVKLSNAGFSPARIVQMIEERRCACDASADGLVALKRQKVSEEVISAVSLHALKPNRSLTILVTLDFIGTGQPTDGAPVSASLGSAPRDSFLYFFLDDGPLTRVFRADVAALLAQHRGIPAMVDRTDPLLTRQVRRLQIAGEIPLKTYGEHTLYVTSAARATINHPGMLVDAERNRGQAYFFDYPRASLQTVCRLAVSYRRDPVLPDKWSFAGSTFECEFN